MGVDESECAQVSVGKLGVHLKVETSDSMEVCFEFIIIILVLEVLLLL